MTTTVSRIAFFTMVTLLMSLLGNYLLQFKQTCIYIFEKKNQSLVSHEVVRLAFQFAQTQF